MYTSTITEICHVILLSVCFFFFSLLAIHHMGYLKQIYISTGPPIAIERENFYGNSYWNRPRQETMGFYQHPQFVLAMQQPKNHNATNFRMSSSDSTGFEDNRENVHAFHEASPSPGFIDFLGVGAT
jgi:hypothetical protein